MRYRFLVFIYLTVNSLNLFSQGVQHDASMYKLLAPGFSSRRYRFIFCCIAFPSAIVERSELVIMTNKSLDR